MAKWCHVCEKWLAGSLTRHLNQNTCKTPTERVQLAAAKRNHRNAQRRVRYRYNRYVRNRDVQDESDSDVEILPTPTVEQEICAICQYAPTDPVTGPKSIAVMFSASNVVACWPMLLIRIARFADSLSFTNRNHQSLTICLTQTTKISVATLSWATRQLWLLYVLHIRRVPYYGF
jgi:hypothetical protein